MRRSILIGSIVVGLWLASAGCDGPGGPPRPLSRGTFSLSIDETLRGEPTDINITELFITRRLLYLGLDRVDDPTQADYRIDGSVHCTYYQKHEFHYFDHSVHLEHQFKAIVKCKITDQREQGDGPREEVLDFPEPLIYGRTEMADAERDIRRDAGTLLSKKIFHGKTFGDPELVALVNALGDSYETRTFNQIIDAFVARGHDAVPYLLEALDDDRAVKLDGQYPGLEESNRDLLAYQHIADAALRRILGRDSGLTLESTTDYLQDIQLAWTWAWEDLQQVPQQYRVRSKERATAVKAQPSG